MENIIQRFHQLSADIETLRILVDESEAKLMMFNDCYKMMGKMNSEKLAEFGKKNETMYLDFIRNHISIVRKISPTIANDLEIRANEFERIVPSYFKILIEKKDLIKNQKKVLSDKNYLIKLMNEEGDDLKKDIKNKERYQKIESLLKKSNDEGIILERETIDLKEKHQRIESEMLLCIIRLHDYVMMTSKSIIDTLDYLKGEKTDD